MDTKVNDACVYVFVVDGFAPELMPGMAFRLDKHFKAKGKKILKCPYCGKEFETVDITVKVELRCLSGKPHTPCHTAMACRVCHNKVGIIYKSA